MQGMNQNAAQPDRQLMVITLSLDMPPGVNKLYMPVTAKRLKQPAGKSGAVRPANLTSDAYETTAKIVKTKICREWADYARGQILYQRSGQTIPYRFTVELLLPEAMTDGDAPIKETLDACQHGGAIINDYYCRRGSWEIDETRSRGSMLVILRELPDKIPQSVLNRILMKNQLSML